MFLTGDIAFSGKAEEYLLAEDFVRKITSELTWTTNEPEAETRSGSRGQSAGLG